MGTTDLRDGEIDPFFRRRGGSVLEIFSFSCGRGGNWLFIRGEKPFALPVFPPNPAKGGERRQLA